MAGLRPVPARKLVRILQEEGFARVSQRGSHLKLRHPDGRTLVVPIHRGRDVKVGLLRAVLAEAGIRVEDFLRRV